MELPRDFEGLPFGLEANASKLPRSNHEALLSWLFQPVDLLTFSRSSWDREILHLAGCGPDRFIGLISIGEIEAALESCPRAFEAGLVSLPRAGAGEAEAPSSVTALRETIACARTVRVRHLEEILPPDAPAMTLVRSLQSALGHPLASLSCYISAAGAEGLGPHQDETHIFTLQISGTKKWRFHGRGAARLSRTYDPLELAPVQRDLTMEPGDFLYVPSGYVHDVCCESSSLSLTIVFDAFTWRTLLAALPDDPAAPWDEALPIGAGGDPDLGIQLIKRLGQSLDALEAAPAEQRRAALAALLVGATPSLRSPKQPSAPAPLTVSDLVQRRPETRCEIVCLEDRAILLLNGGRTLSLDRAAETALAYAVGATGPFVVDSLPDMLSAGAKTALCQALIDHCVLCRRTKADERS